MRFLNTGPGSKKKQRNAKTDPDGRLIFGDEDDKEDADMAGNGDGSGGVNAYLEAVSGPDAARRGQKGKVKMSQAHTKKKQQQSDGMDIDDDDGAVTKEDFRAAKFDGGRRGLGMAKSHGPSVGAGRVQKKGRGGGVKGRPQRGRGRR